MPILCQKVMQLEDIFPVDVFGEDDTPFTSHATKHTLRYVLRDGKWSKIVRGLSVSFLNGKIVLHINNEICYELRTYLSLKCACSIWTEDGSWPFQA